MIKASSLFYAIVISLIIAIVSSSLILFAYLTRIQFDNFEINQRLNLNADSGLNLLMSKQSLVELNESKTIDLYSTGIDSVELSRKLWGAYEVVISKATFKSTSISRTAQIGFYPDSTRAYSLYLVDDDKPLALCGNTKIKGMALLPKSGVKRAYIEGQSFSGKTLVEGAIKQSERNLPDFNKKMLEGIVAVFSSKSIASDDSIIHLEKGLSGDTIINSFTNRTLVFTSQNQLQISDGKYTGNIAFISATKITITANTILNDVILYAPKVFIEKGFKGNVQVFASDSILLKEDVSLNYPSALGLLNNDQSPTVSAIVLSGNDTVSGNIFAYKQERTVLKHVNILIKEKAIVNGQIYSNSYADVKGGIFGSLMCNKIILTTPSSVYENHLLNATIDLSKLSKHYVGINLVEESMAKKVVKWLD